WGYDIAKQYFGAEEIDGGPWCKIPMGKPGAGIVIKDAIADITLQQVLLRPEDFDVIATLNLNGDYLSDALAAQVGGIGIAPGGNINYITGHAVFEATHGTAPKYANQDKVNPGSVILSGEMMFRYMGWAEAADLILKGLKGAIASKRVTYDFARLMDGATEIKCSQFGDNVIEHMRRGRSAAANAEIRMSNVEITNQMKKKYCSAPSPFDVALVARRKILALRSRNRKGRQTRAAAIVGLTDGRRGLIFVYRSTKRREQSGLVARRKDDCLHERDESGGSGQAGKEKEK